MKFSGARDMQMLETQVHPVRQKSQSHILHLIGETLPAFTIFYSLNLPGDLMETEE